MGSDPWAAPVHRRERICLGLDWVLLYLKLGRRFDQPCLYSLFIWMLRMPFTILAPLIFVLSIVGGFAASRSMHDLWLIVIFGIAAFFMRKFDYPLAPAVLAIVLGPIAEPTLRQSLLLSSGDPMVFLQGQSPLRS